MLFPFLARKITQAQKGSTFETQILETSIQKIGALLAVGFGDAGKLLQFCFLGHQQVPVAAACEDLIL